MAKMTTDELLGTFEEMTVLELSEFLKAFEEKFEVTAAAPVAVAAVAAGGDAAAEVEEQDEFDRRAHRRRRQEDPGDQGSSWSHEPWSQGSQGARRRSSVEHPRGCRQGDRRQGQGRPRSRRRFSRTEVAQTVLEGSGYARSLRRAHRSHLLACDYLILVGSLHGWPGNGSQDSRLLPERVGRGPADAERASWTRVDPNP